MLNLAENELTLLPPEVRSWITIQLSKLGKLNRLSALYIRSNPNLMFPPSHILKRGTKIILSFLKDFLLDNNKRDTTGTFDLPTDMRMFMDNGRDFFSDLVIRVEDVQFHVHRIVLAARSLTFRNQFVSDS